MYANTLFHQKGWLSEFLEKRKAELRSEIETSDRDYILKVSEQSYCDYLFSKYRLDAPRIFEDKIQSDNPSDVTCDNPMTALIDDFPSKVKGTRFRLHIPFEGEKELFHYIPSTYTDPPHGVVFQNEIQLFYDYPMTPSPEEIKRDYQKDLKLIVQFLTWVRNDVSGYNEQIKTISGQLLTARKRKILNDCHILESLGFPLKSRQSISTTYTIPSIRQKLTVEPPKVQNASFKPEPTIADEEYEGILEKLCAMSIAMEYIPKSFAKLAEPDIRNFFLILLNAQYEGRATGETFNFDGKTDILIREQDRNVFIAECKFWGGPEELLKTIDQLLGYLSWRDTKTSILLFNRNKSFSSVLEKVLPAATSHSNFRRLHSLKSEKLKKPTIFPLVFHQPNDINREVFLTIMAFDIPTE